MAVVLTAALVLPATALNAEPSPTDRAEADGAPALSADRFSQLEERLRLLNRRRIAAAFARGDGEAESCELSRHDFRCRCLRLAGGESTLQIARWRSAEGETRLSGLVVTGVDGRVRLTARRGLLTDQRLVLRDGVVFGSDDTLAFERAVKVNRE